MLHAAVTHRTKLRIQIRPMLPNVFYWYALSSKCFGLSWTVTANFQKQPRIL